jgi:hypothetical protein
MTPLLLGTLLLLGGILFFILFFKLLRNVFKSILTAVVLVLVVFLILHFAGISATDVLFPSNETNNTDVTNQTIVENLTTQVALTGNVILGKVTDKLIDLGKDKLDDMRHADAVIQ